MHVWLQCKMTNILKKNKTNVSKWINYDFKKPLPYHYMIYNCDIQWFKMIQSSLYTIINSVTVLYRAMGKK